MDPIELANLAYDLSKEKRNHSNIHLYNKSNENLYELFKHYNIHGKDVLSVLASSDQLFSCYTNGAKSVDTFDMSYVSLYYYYLRKWLIENNNMLYIPLDLFYNKSIDIYNLICSIKPKTKEEKEAKIFWEKYLQLNNYKFDEYLFSISKNDYKSPFSNNINYLKTRLKDNINFYHLNIIKDVDIDKKYDVIIMSNILEFVATEENQIRVRNNIENLLNNNGIVICSYLMDNNASIYHKKEIEVMTANKLILSEENEYYDAIKKRQKCLSYTYKKTR